MQPKVILRLRNASLAMESAAKPRRGMEIFEGGYPASWDEFIGQRLARQHLQAAVASAKALGEPLDPILLASGSAGIGKSSLARLVAGQMEAGLRELSGKIKVDEARTALRTMDDGDVLFIDEIHQCAGTQGEWLLHYLQDGRLLTGRGPEKMPQVTIIGATTDAQKLSPAVLSRFRIRPSLVAYTEHEAELIAAGLAKRMGLGSKLPEAEVGDLKALARAGNRSPREIAALLTAYKQTFHAAQRYDLQMTLAWTQVTEDGLNLTAQRYMLALLDCGGTGSLAAIAGLMDEPGPLHQTEQLLRSNGFLDVTPAGRTLTEDGLKRARQLTLAMEGGDE